jgi:hypothetical protein
MSDLSTQRPTINPQPWQRGTDLRDNGIYTWPQMYFPSGDRKYYPSVTSILEYTTGNMKYAEQWWTAQYVAELVNAHEKNEPIEIWDRVQKKLVLKPALDVLKDKHWIKSAGAREMHRRADRGSILHAAFEDYTRLGLRLKPSEIKDYTRHLIVARDIHLHTDYCADRIARLLAWCERHIAETHFSEIVLMNDTFWYAGSGDWCGTLQNLPDHYISTSQSAIRIPLPKYPVAFLDLKGSDGPQDSHELQVAGAYNNAEWMGVRGTDQRVPFEQAQFVGNLYATKTGIDLKFWENSAAAFAAFLHFRAAWQWSQAAEAPVPIKPPRVALPKAGRDK